MSFIRSPISGAVNFLGWADYTDTQYTEAEPFQIAADTETNLPNNAGTIRSAYLPDDLAALYAGGKILGREGEAIGVTIDFKCKPTNQNTTYIENWIDIGSPVGELYRRINTFPKGQDVERNITNSTFAYTLDTWETNGGTVRVNSDNTCDIYDIRYVIFRLSKAT